MCFPCRRGSLSATASVYGLASVGSGLGGAIFQSLSEWQLKSFLTIHYSIAYNIVFIGYGLMALTGILILIFIQGRSSVIPNLAICRNHLYEILLCKKINIKKFPGMKKIRLMLVFLFQITIMFSQKNFSFVFLPDLHLRPDSSTLEDFERVIRADQSHQTRLCADRW